MRADHDVDVARLQTLHRPRLRLVIHESRQHLDHDREILEPLPEDVEMLLGEHGGRRKERDLLAAHRGLERRPQGQLRLAKAHVAAQQPVHRLV